MDELLVVAIEVEKILGEIGKTPYEPLHEEREEELALGNISNNKHLQVLNETLVNYFGRRIDGKVVPTLGKNNTIQCQICKSKKKITFACPKFINLRPKCAKCGGGHKIENCILKCYFCSGMGHT